jgi:phage terminase large subunit-like protein
MAVAVSEQDVLNREAGARVHDYARKVVAGEIVAGELLRLACERHLRDLEDGEARGLRFDELAAGWTIRFFPAVLRHYKGEWGPRGNQPGKPVELLPWEEFVVGSIFGWMRRNPAPEHEVAWIRRFTRAYVEVGKKNGKDLLAAGCGIRLAFFDDEPGAEVYCVATKRDQAKLTWSDMDTLVAKSPALKARIKRSARSLFDDQTSSKVMPLSSEEGGEEGINPHGGLVNELHRHANDRMLGMVENSFGARLQPLLLIYTTAGEPGGQTVWASERRMAERMLRAIDENDQYFAAVYAIDEHDDPFDERCWPKANPSMPITPKLEEMRQRAAEAKAEPSKLNAFLRLRLNRPSSSTSRYFDVTAWHDERNSEQPDPPDGQDAWGGFDLGWSRDLSAFGLWIPRDDGRFDIRMRCWAPEASARARGDGLYERFADLGVLTLTEGDVRDDDVIEADILQACVGYRVRKIKYDRALASGLVTRLQRALGDDIVEPVGQGWVSLSPAMKELDRLSVARRLVHGGNQLLLWAVGNTDGKDDDNGNVRPVKPNRNSPDKIDPVSAILDAIAGWMPDQVEEDEVSAYEGLTEHEILERMRV